MLDQSQQFLFEIDYCLPSSIFDEFIVKSQALIMSEKTPLDDIFYDLIGCQRY